MAAPHLFKSSFWAACDYFFNKVVSVVVTQAFIARAVQPEEFGIFSTAVMVAQSLWVLVDFGITRYGIREIAKAPDSTRQISIAWELLCIRLANALIVLVGFLCLVLLFFRADNWKAPMAICATSTLVQALTPDYYFKAILAFRMVFLSDLLAAILFVLAVKIMVAGSGDLLLACALWAASSLPAAVLLLKAILIQGGSVVSFLRFDLAASLSHIKETKHFFFAALLDNLYISSPVYLVTSLMGEAAAGYFNASYRLYLYLASIILPISQVFFPILSRTHSIGSASKFLEGRACFQRIVIALMLPAVAVTSLFGRDIVAMIFGSKFEGSSWILQWLSVPLLLSTLRLTFSLPIAASGNQRVLVLISAVLALASAAAGYLLIRLGGIAGIVIAVAASEIAFLMALMIGAKRILSVSIRNIDSGVPWKAMISISFSSLFMWQAGFSVISLAGGSIVYVTLLYILGEWDALMAGMAE